MFAVQPIEWTSPRTPKPPHPHPEGPSGPEGVLLVLRCSSPAHLTPPLPPPFSLLHSSLSISSRTDAVTETQNLCQPGMATNEAEMRNVDSFQFSSRTFNGLHGDSRSAEGRRHRYSTDKPHFVRTELIHSGTSTRKGLF